MIVTTYDKLIEYVRAFSTGEISLLVIRSSGGLGKTFTTKKATKGQDVTHFNGHATPLSIYLRLAQGPESLVVFDDVDTLINNKNSVALLKQLCELEDSKTVRYDTTAKLAGVQIPPHFTSYNRVCLLCNDFKRVGRNLKALLTRGIYIDFQPTDDEVLKVMSSFYGLDKEIYEHLAKHKNEISDLNLRLYHKCVELKQAGLDWKDYIKSEFGINRDTELAIQLSDLPEELRDAKWQAETGKSVRTLQRILKRQTTG
jgi:hypothetical protein